MRACSPEELEALLEDAVLLRDTAAVQLLYDPGAVLAGPGWVGGPARAAELLGAYVPGPLSVLGDVALAVGEGAVTVSRCGRDRRWSLVASITRARGL